MAKNKIVAFFCELLQMPKVNNRPTCGNSPNLVTLTKTHHTMYIHMMYIHMYYNDLT
jgi:hypothetical protein